MMRGEGGAGSRIFGGGGRLRDGSVSLCFFSIVFLVSLFSTLFHFSIFFRIFPDSPQIAPDFPQIFNVSPEITAKNTKNCKNPRINQTN